MKNSTIRATVAMALLGALALGCSKKQQPLDNDPIATRTLRYLTQRPWRETGAEYERLDGSWIPATVPAATLAQVTTFRTDGTFAIVSGNLSSIGVYDIIGDNHQLAINKSVTYDLSILDDSTMQLTLPGQQEYPDPSKGTATTYYGSRQTFAH